MEQNILFTNRQWTDKNKEKYFRQYLKNKENCDFWHKKTAAYKSIRLFKSRRIYLEGGIWQDIMEEQLYEPIIKTRLAARIW